MPHPASWPATYQEACANGPKKSLRYLLLWSVTAHTLRQMGQTLELEQHPSAYGIEQAGMDGICQAMQHMPSPFTTVSGLWIMSGR